MKDATEPPPGVGARDWAQTPQAVRILVLALQEQVSTLSERVAAREERTRGTSRNSAQPPASDPPRVPPGVQRQRSGRKRGGPCGQEGHGRALLPAAQVDQVSESTPQTCAHGGEALAGVDPAPARHQVSEVPQVAVQVTEYRRHTLVCPACGEATTADWPVGMPIGSFGPQVAATVAYLTGRCGVSPREAQAILRTLGHLEMSLGSSAALAQTVRAAVAAPVAEAQAAVAAPVAEAQAAVQAAPVVNVAETSWQEQTQRCGLWVAGSTLLTVFLVRPSRGSRSAKALVGVTDAGSVGSDRRSGYTWLRLPQRQICWAHLIRDFEALVERGGPAAVLGTALLDRADRRFALWYRLRTGDLDRPAFPLLVAPLQAELHALLGTGLDQPHPKTRQHCATLLKGEAARWTFVTVPDVEPTNNQAERALRRAVLWRRRSFGTQRASGTRSVERMLTVVATLRQQDRDVLDYLLAATQAASLGSAAPSLLPAAPAPATEGFAFAA
jgi:transposase